MLDVDGRGDVDTRSEDLVDVLVALAVARLGQVRVGELVDERDLGAASDDRVDVHLREVEPPESAPQMRHLFEPLGKRRGLRAVVRLEVADHDVVPFLPGLAALLEHPVRLADSCGHAEQDPVPAPQV